MAVSRHQAGGRGWGNCSVGKMHAAQVLGPEFDLWRHYKLSSIVISKVSSTLGNLVLGRQRQEDASTNS